MSDRNRDPTYRKWRKEVYKRDNYKCQMPGCDGTCKKLNAHHIKRDATFPELSRLVDNGICLCERCHEKTFGREEEFEQIFQRIVINKKKVDISLMFLKYKK